MRVVLLRLLGAVILLGGLAVGWLYMDYSRFGDAPLQVAAEGLEFTIEPGTTLASLARRLEAEKVIPSARNFRWMARVSGSANSIKAGTYRLRQEMTVSELLHEIVEGRVAHFGLTLVEGWNFRQMMDVVNRNPNLRHTLVKLTDEQLMAKLGFTGEHPEGRFFPDTYNFPRGLTDVVFLQRAHRAMSERLAYEWEHRDEGLPYQFPEQALTMASIVEKETGVAWERSQIAGVFVRRLRKGMRLQTDPTVIYGLGINFDGNLRRRDLLADNPYNTYRIYGLPPTPIAMPGAEAIHAALHPAAGDALYFVAKGDGSHYFSATLAEHNAAVVRYQLRGRARPFSSSP
jgi:UPF0755 protein